MSASRRAAAAPGAGAPGAGAPVADPPAGGTPGGATQSGNRGTKRLRTRAKLVEAAAQVIAEEGYERTSLEQVAARAGMTRGAIYGNFRNKEDLFLAVVAAKWQPIIPPLPEGSGAAPPLASLADAVVAAMPARRAAAIGAVSFQLYALTHEAMRLRIVRANAAIYSQMAAGLAGLGAEAGIGMAPEMFVRVMHALIDGLMLLHALTPELIDADVVRAAINAIVRQGKVGGDEPSAPNP
jgi:AcrR family transcriptional regulator